MEIILSQESKPTPLTACQVKEMIAYYSVSIFSTRFLSVENSAEFARLIATEPVSQNPFLPQFSLAEMGWENGAAIIFSENSVEPSICPAGAKLFSTRPGANATEILRHVPRLLALKTTHDFGSFFTQSQAAFVLKEFTLAVNFSDKKQTLSESDHGELLRFAESAMGGVYELHLHEGSVVSSETVLNNMRTTRKAEMPPLRSTKQGGHSHDIH